MLIVSETDYPEILMIQLSGKLDFMNADDIEQSIKEIITSSNKNLLINMKEVTFISSSGIRVLLIITKLAESLGLKVIFFELSEKALYLVDILGLRDQLLIADNYHIAIALLK